MQDAIEGQPGKNNCLRSNLIILGDNRSVCDNLLTQYESEVKCVYIDPPYNNGEKYAHYNDPREHDAWMLNMRGILPRLWRFLSHDGSIWISIDDYEVHYLKVLCDELFGRNSFVTTIIWEHRTSRENRKAFSNNHEYILVYAKDSATFKKTRNLLPLSGEILSRYKNPDNDSRGPWQSVTLSVQAGHAVDSQFYSIRSPSGKRFNPPAGRCWIYNEERMLKEIAANNIWFGADGNSTPRKKMFLADAKPGITPETLWKAQDVGTTNKAKKQLLTLLPSAAAFDTPKPEGLIGRILEIATNKDDIVLDAFLGSGTTAVVANSMGRRYIGIDSSRDSINYALERMKKALAGGGKDSSELPFTFFEYADSQEPGCVR